MQEKKKNVVLITMDECKASALGCYNTAYSVSEGIDTFAQDGVLFEQCFTVMPKCVPSRAAMLTGRYCHTDGHRTLPGFEVRSGEPNFIHTLKKNGYKTGMFGKNHTFESGAFEENLDVYCKDLKGIDVPWQRGENETDDELFRAFYRGDFSCTESMRDTIATREAQKFFEEAGGHPFFALINYNAPHPPYTDIQPFIAQVRAKNIPLPTIEEINQCPEILKETRMVYDLEGMTEEKWRKVVEGYYSLVAYVSDQISQLLAKLKELGLYEESLVIVTADHGDFAGEHGAVEKCDTLFYDCLTHIPLIIKLSGNEFSGQRRKTLCENIDLAPTILELLGLEISEHIHGSSLVPSLQDPAYIHTEQVFSEGGVEFHALQRSVHYNSSEHRKRHPNYIWKQILMVDYPSSMYRAKMIRTERWKLIYRVDNTIELFDLVNDPGEFCNVAKDPSNKEIINDLIFRLLNWCIQTETDYPRIEKMYS
jgi:choline-sulfatase